MRFIDTPYNCDPYVEELERNDAQSDTVLIAGRSSSDLHHLQIIFSGLQTGTAYVTVSSSFRSHDIKSTRIRLTVRDKVLLNPSGVVYLAKFDSILFQIEKWRNGRPTSNSEISISE